MRIVALDLGTKCGWASCASENDPIISGVENLKPGSRQESPGLRFIRFKALLVALEIASDPANTIVIYEEVRRHAGTTAAHVYGGLESHLQAYCHENGVQFSSVPVGVIKKHATGKGNAGKEQMIEAANAKHGNELVGIVSDDNEADAIHLLDYWRKNGPA